MAEIGAAISAAREEAKRVRGLCKEVGSAVTQVQRQLRTYERELQKKLASDKATSSVAASDVESAADMPRAAHFMAKAFY